MQVKGGYPHKTMHKQCWFSGLFLSLLVLATTSLGNSGHLSKQNGSNSSIPALFIFGDSTVDPGNNNYINTLFKSDFPPYGVDFPHQTPTGRFTDGMLPTDFIASYIGVKKTIPAYLDPSLSLKDLMTGVSFASAGSGYDPLTSTKTSVIGVSMQLEYFEEYKKKLEEMIGKKRTKGIIKNALYIVSAGTNDIVYTFGLVDSPLLTSTVPAYLHFLLNQCKCFTQKLMDGGARKIAVVGLPPVGCLPVIMAVHSSWQEAGKCDESLSSIARDYNQMLEAQVKAMQASQPNNLVAYADIYGPLYDQVINPQHYGFDVVDTGCCGTSSLGKAGILCNCLSQICSNRSRYMFWDSIHPTERSYFYLFQAVSHVVDLFL